MEFIYITFLSFLPFFALSNLFFFFFENSKPLGLLNFPLFFFPLTITREKKKAEKEGLFRVGKKKKLKKKKTITCKEFLNKRCLFNLLVLLDLKSFVVFLANTFFFLKLYLNHLHKLKEEEKPDKVKNRSSKWP